MSGEQQQGALADANIAPTAALLANPARAVMLWSLSDGRALPAGELARVARVASSTVSEHLAKLIAGGLLAVERHGRHRYYRLSDPAIVAALEALAVVAPPTRAASPKEASASNAVRYARTCYDHLAGHLAVQIANVLLEEGALVLADRAYEVTSAGTRYFAALGIDTNALQTEASAKRRVFARACLDWSECHYHVAGLLGAALCNRLLVLQWLERRPASRALRITNAGRRAFRRQFNVSVFEERNTSGPATGLALNEAQHL